MKKPMAFLLSIVLCLNLCACGASAEINSGTTTKTDDISKKSQSQIIDEMLQGVWYWEDEVASEEFYFDKGRFSYDIFVKAAPEGGGFSTGSYSIKDGYIRIGIDRDRDVILLYPYEFEDGELIFTRKIDSGYDAGTTRVYRKQYGFSED